jgi:hypothetical protein
LWHLARNVQGSIDPAGHAASPEDGRRRETYRLHGGDGKCEPRSAIGLDCGRASAARRAAGDTGVIRAARNEKGEPAGSPSRVGTGRRAQ